MPLCTVCTEPLPAEAKSCPVCGTSVPSSAAETASAASPPTSMGDASAGPLPTPAAELPAADGGRTCPACHRVYAADYADSFCECGAELLVARQGVAGPATSTITSPLEVPAVAPTSAGPIRPPAGTICLTVYSSGREPIHYHVLDGDVTLIGRSDPIRGDFPDLDLGQLLDEATAKRISRKHAVVLRSRETKQFALRPLAKNTGTQIERELAAELTDYPLTDGIRLILGGVVRLKFEVIK